MIYLLHQGFPARFRIIEAEKAVVKAEAEAMVRETGQEVTIWEYCSRCAAEPLGSPVWPERKGAEK